MANLGIEIKRKCPICGKVFIIKTLDSVYCSPKCSKIANKRKKDKEKKEALFVTYAQNVPDIREYLTARQVVAIYGIERSTLYRLAKLGKIPFTRQTHVTNRSKSTTVSYIVKINLSKRNLKPSVVL